MPCVFAKIPSLRTVFVIKVTRQRCLFSTHAMQTWQVNAALNMHTRYLQTFECSYWAGADCKMAAYRSCSFLRVCVVLSAMRRTDC